VSTALRLVLADLRARTTLILGTALLVAVPISGYLLLYGFARGIEIDWAQVSTSDLIVQEANSVGEIAGSRISASIERDLLDLGVVFAIPEIHAVAGSSAENAVLLRGIDPERYQSIASFEIVDGRELRPGDSDTSTMIGVDLASSRGVEAGDPIRLRGRLYEVTGVFEIGTYADNEAWLSLPAARDLLGWGDDVSVFVVPDDGSLSQGDVLPGPLSVARRGDVVEVANEWDPLISLSGYATFANAVAASIVLAAVLWRLMWLRRRELAVLRTIGLGRGIAMLYLLFIGAAVAVVGLVGGIAGALALRRAVEIEALGIVTRATFDGSGIFRGAMLTVGILIFGTAVAGVRALRAKPVEFLRGD